MTNILNKFTISKTSDSDYIGFDGKFKADARTQEKETSKGVVTNFYVEDGSQTSDNIIISPRILTVSGEVSNVYYQKSLLTNSFTEVNEALGNIDIFLPNKTASQISTINKYVNDFEDAKRKVEDYNSRLSKVSKYATKVLGNDTLQNLIVQEDKTTKSTQSAFVKMIREYHQLKRLMRIETLRYGIFENMAIVGYSFAKNEDDYLTYSIDFQEIRFAKTTVTPIKQIAKKPSGTQANIQTSDKQDKGIIQGTSKSLLSKIGDLF